MDMAFSFLDIDRMHRDFKIVDDLVNDKRRSTIPSLESYFAEYGGISEEMLPALKKGESAYKKLGKTDAEARAYILGLSHAITVGENNDVKTFLRGEVMKKKKNLKSMMLRKERLLQKNKEKERQKENLNHRERFKEVQKERHRRHLTPRFDISLNRSMENEHYLPFDETSRLTDSLLSETSLMYSPGKSFVHEEPEDKGTIKYGKYMLDRRWILNLIDTVPNVRSNKHRPFLLNVETIEIPLEPLENDLPDPRVD